MDHPMRHTGTMDTAYETSQPIHCTRANWAYVSIAENPFPKQGELFEFFSKIATNESPRGSSSQIRTLIPGFRHETHYLTWYETCGCTDHLHINGNVPR
jgi:hypothetical protein